MFVFVGYRGEKMTAANLAHLISVSVFISNVQCTIKLWNECDQCVDDVFMLNNCSALRKAVRHTFKLR